MSVCAGIMEWAMFLKNFIRDKNVAALVPSSQLSVRKVCSKINFDKDNVIVEYGPGTGVFTKYILKKMSPKSKLILIEANKEFTRKLKEINDPRVILFNGSAENVEEILNRCNEKSADYVVSGIPFSFFDEALKRRIISRSYNVLSRRGKFLIYQYSYHVKRYLQQYFDEIHHDFQPFNIFPLFILEGIK